MGNQLTKPNHEPRNELEGRRVWVTAERRADSQRRYLERRGAVVMTTPLLRTLDDASPNDCETLAHQLINAPPEVFIAQTGQGLDWWTQRLDAQTKDKFLNALSDSSIWSRGAKSTSRCRSLGLTVSWQSKSETAREVAEQCATLPPGCRVGVQLVGTVRDVVLDALEQIDADVIAMRVYRYGLPVDLQRCHELINETISGKVDAITFTASPAIEHLRAIARDIGLCQQLDATIGRTCKAIVVGPVCAATALDAGWDSVVEPETARLIPMLDALTDALDGVC